MILFTPEFQKRENTHKIIPTSGPALKQSKIKVDFLIGDANPTSVSSAFLFAFSEQNIILRSEESFCVSIFFRGFHSKFSNVH